MKITIEIDIKYITDDIIDSMPSTDAIELFKSLLNTMRPDTADEADGGSEAIETIPETIPEPTIAESVPNIDKRKAEIDIPWDGEKRDCPYYGVTYLPSGNSFMTRFKNQTIQKRKDPIYVAIAYDMFIDAIGLDREKYPRNYHDFDEVSEVYKEIPTDEIIERENTIKIKADKYKETL